MSEYSNKTWIREPDLYEWPDDSLESEGLQRFSGTYSGSEWTVAHDLNSFNLVITIWATTDTVTYDKIELLNENTVHVEFSGYAEGIINIYCITPRLGLGYVHEQTTPSSIWEFDHNLGTDEVICNFWVEGIPATPTSITVNETSMRAEFRRNVTGRAVVVLANRFNASNMQVSWYQLTDLPLEFPPGEHTHDGTDIQTPVPDSDKLGGISAANYVSAAQVGTQIPPLVGGKIPIEYLANGCPFIVESGTGSVVAYRLVVDDATTPFRVELQDTTNKAILGMKPIVAGMTLEGNVISNYGNKLVPAQDNKVILSAGDGIRFEQNGAGRLGIYAEGNERKVYRKSDGIPPDGLWQIVDEVFHTPMLSTINLWEVTPEEIGLTGNSAHISGVSDIASILKHKSGDELLCMDPDGETATSTQIGTDHHTHEKERSVTNLPFDALALYYDEIETRFLVYTRDLTYVTQYHFYEMQPDGSITDLGMIDETLIPDISCMTIHNGYIWRLREVSSTETALEYTDLSSFPSVSWNLELTHTGVPLPESSGKFMIDGSYIYIYQSSVNRLFVFDRSTGLQSTYHTFSRPTADLTLWDSDSYILTSSGYGHVLKSDGSGASFTTFTQGIENKLGNMSLLSAGNGVTMGIKDREVFIGDQHTDETPVYEYGSATYWTTSTSAWQIPVDTNSVYNLTPTPNLDVSDIVDLRFGFFISEAPNPQPPNTVWVWDTSTEEWDKTVPLTEIATRGNTLNDLSYVTLEERGQYLQYVMYIEKQGRFHPFEFSMNMDYTYDSLVQYGPAITSNRESAVAGVGYLVKVVHNAMVIRNFTGAESNELVLVVG